MSRERVVIVTGVSSGIGRATAELLARRGYRVFGTLRSDALAGGGPAGVESVRLDVRDGESARSCVRTALERAGRIDGLVNNAGYALIGSAEDTSIQEAVELFETNFFGALRMIREVLPAMRAQGAGRIVNIGSVAGFLPSPYMGIYAASKYALEGYSESLDHEVRQFGVRVCVVEPGFIRTDLARNSRAAGRQSPEYAGERDRVHDALRTSVAAGGDPAGVAAVVVEALESGSPRPAYHAGRQAKVLGLLKKFAPAKALDKGIRRQFGLPAG